MVSQRQISKPRWIPETWKHNKCHTLLHVFKKGIKIGQLCYCKRRKFGIQNGTQSFIETN